MAKKEEIGKVVNLEMDMIDPPADVARLEIPQKEIMELAQSIKEQGLLQNIVVAERDGRYEIVAGHRRFLAFKYLKKKNISCKVVESDPRIIALARAVENIQDKNLSPLEEGMTYKGLFEKLGMGLDEIGEKMGVSAGVVRRRLNILKMPDSLIDAVHKKLITQSVAEELMRCPDVAYREYLIEMSRDHGVTNLVARGWVDDRLKQLRREDSDNGGSNLLEKVYVERPVYLTCQACSKACDSTKAKSILICPECEKIIIEMIKSGNFKKGGDD